MVNIITRKHAGRSGVQILDGAGELPLLQNIPARTDSMTIHSLIEQSLRISGAIPPLNLSASWHILGQFIVPQPPTYVHITELIS
jgi:hypothetical protein